MAHNVVLTWVAPVGSTVTAYDVQRAPVVGGVTGTFVTIDNPEVSGTTFTDNGPFTEGQVFSYRVASVNPSGESVPCAAVTATIPYFLPGPPTNLVATVS